MSDKNIPWSRRTWGDRFVLKVDIQDIGKFLMIHSKLSHSYSIIWWFYNYVEDSFRHPNNNHCYLLTEFIKIHKGSIVECRIIKHICQHPGEWVGWLLGRCMPAVLQAEASAEEAADRHSEEQQIIFIFSVVPLSLQDKTKPDHDGAMLCFLYGKRAVSTQTLTFGVSSSRKKLKPTAAGMRI